MIQLPIYACIFSRIWIEIGCSVLGFLEYVKCLKLLNYVVNDVYMSCFGAWNK